MCVSSSSLLLRTYVCKILPDISTSSNSVCIKPKVSTCLCKCAFFHPSSLSQGIVWSFLQLPKPESLEFFLRPGAIFYPYVEYCFFFFKATRQCLTIYEVFINSIGWIVWLQVYSHSINFLLSSQSDVLKHVPVAALIPFNGSPLSTG